MSVSRMLESDLLAPADVRDEGADSREVRAAYRQFLVPGHAHQRSLVASEDRVDVAMCYPVGAMHL